MKNLTTTLLFLIAGFCGFSQGVFTEKTLSEISDKMLADFVKSANEDPAPGYHFVLAEGVVINKDQMKEMAPGMKISEWSLSDVKIKQAGNIAVVTGQNKHITISLSDNKATSHNVRFTYIYEFIDGKWYWYYAQHTNIVQ